MRKEVQKGLINHEVNKELLGFVTLEIVLLIGIITYIGAVNFGWNIIATILIGGTSVFILTFTPLYPVLGVLFSIGWGYLGYKLIHWLTTFSGGGEGLAITIGILGAILTFLLTIGARVGGKEYIDHIE